MVEIVPKTVTDDCAIPIVGYRNLPVDHINIALSEPTKNKKRNIEHLTLDGEIVHPTKRFSQSLASLYGFSDNIYKFFDPDEVIGRIVERGFSDRVRVTVQENKDGSMTALGVTKPTRSIIDPQELFFALRERGVKDVSYDDGVIRSVHTPSVLGNGSFKVGGDEMIRRFVVDTPVDGYGLPTSYLSLLRLVCSNGMVGYAKAFKSQINIGDGNPMATFTRFLESYNNEEGFSAIRARYEAATRSPASLDEFYNFYCNVTGPKMESMHDNKNILESDITKRVREIGGGPVEIYGLVSLDQLSAKARSRVPVACSVADLLNFGSELATHRADTYQSRKLSAWIGSTLANSGGYDLEGVLGDNEKPEDLFVTASSVAEAHNNEVLN